MAAELVHDPSGNPPLLLDAIPDELIQLILSFLSTVDLKSTALVSKILHSHATDFLFKHVILRDTWRLHLNDETRHLWGDRGNGDCDEHDDTPIIQKLYILAINPTLASKVQTVTHRCHLPTPSIFAELPYVHFADDNLSHIAELHTLVRLAVRNLRNVHTLRIICGHQRLTASLINAFFDANRKYNVPLRKLWLESCSLKGVTRQPQDTWQHGLESLRIRRLRVVEPDQDTMEDMHFPVYRAARAGRPFQLHDGAGGFYWTTVEFAILHAPGRFSETLIPPEDMLAKANGYDNAIWADLPEIMWYVHMYHHLVQAPTERVTEECDGHREIPLPFFFALLRPSSTLVKLTLDWLLWFPVGMPPAMNNDPRDCISEKTLRQLSKQTFPNLRAFQIRNAVTPPTRLHHDVVLFGNHLLRFLEAHPKLECLAFPLEHFFDYSPPDQLTANRIRRVVAHLGATLVDLRLDMCYNQGADPLIDRGGPDMKAEQCRIRRRRFISDFAPHMRKLQQIKLEGGIPRDEKREILRALHYCPLKKIVMIGASFPLGNTWGHGGEALSELLHGAIDPIPGLEDEDADGIEDTISTSLTTNPSGSFVFEPSYGWPRGSSLLHTIATHNASKVEEVKLCGFNGAPLLSHFTPITRPLLYPLVHFHNLRTLIISLHLVTYFESDFRDTEIIQSWLDTRSPTSTALVVVTPPASPTPSPPAGVTPTPYPNLPGTTVPIPAVRPQEFNRWAVALKTRFTPSALAYRVAADIGPFLSPRAKARRGGVRVRASFALGTRGEGRSANDIFDLDIRVGANDSVLEFVGPREEGEKGRWWGKLEGRRWF